MSYDAVAGGWIAAGIFTTRSGHAFMRSQVRNTANVGTANGMDLNPSIMRSANFKFDKGKIALYRLRSGWIRCRRGFSGHDWGRSDIILRSNSFMVGQFLVLPTPMRLLGFRWGQDSVALRRDC